MFLTPETPNLCAIKIAQDYLSMMNNKTTFKHRHSQHNPLKTTLKQVAKNLIVITSITIAACANNTTSNKSEFSAENTTSIYTLNSQNSCNKNIKLEILGSGGPEFDDHRASTGYLIWIDNKARFLVDFGSGSALHFEQSNARIEDISAVLLTHLHVDHTADLPALIKASYFTGRSENLLIFGPTGNFKMPDTEEFITGLFGELGPFRYLSDYLPDYLPSTNNEQSQYVIETQNIDHLKQEIVTHKIEDDLHISATGVKHGIIPAIAWRIDIGSCSISFSGDMNTGGDAFIPLIKNSDVWVAHNAVPEDAGRIAKSLHMPPSVIGEFAKAANIQQLIVSHRMNRTLGREQETKQGIEQSFSGKIYFAEDRDQFILNERSSD